MKKTLTLLLALLLVFSLLSACSDGEDQQDATPNGSGSAGQTDSGGSGGQPKSTAVAIGYVGSHDYSMPSSSGSNDFITQMMIYDKIFEADDHTGEIVSRVLESWEWVDDLTFKMVMKPDIYFSDGTQATNTDLVYSLYTMVFNDDGTQKGRSDKQAYYQYIDFDKTYADDDGLTVYLVWQMEYAQAFLSLDTCLLNEEFCRAHPDTDEIWYTGPVGSGPYEITNVQIDSYIVFTLRDDYWNKDYSYDATEITVKFYSDSTGMYVDYQNGVIDAMYDVNGTIVEQVQAAGNQGTVVFTSGGNVALLNFNERNEYLSNIKVREAIAYALDMDAIGEIAFGALYKKATSHIPEGFSAYTYNDGYTYDLDRAQAALDESGYKGSEISLHYVAVNDGVQPKVAEAVQGYLSMLGITVVVEALDLGTALPMFLDANICDFLYFTRTGGNPMQEMTNVFGAYHADSNFKCAAISDPEFNRLYTMVNETHDEEIIKEGCLAIDAWLYENYHCLPVAEQQAALVYNSRISSFDQASMLKACLGSLTLA